MPYYVYRIHTDNRDNQLLNSFEDVTGFRDALKLEEDWKSVQHLERQDYFITMFYAENDQEAEIYANGLRPHS
ncbi:MAG: hypothetical protein PHU44_01405 [Syntrophales bacterium]|nr:hypothetical protein [Syntrophales bacterium]MDD5642101.1 hypothetical protein [Syntrophales bacterium]